MKNADVEARLRSELSRSVDTTPDERILERIRAGSVDAASSNGSTVRAQRGGYVTTIAAGAAVLLGAVLALSSADPSDAPIQTGAETTTNDLIIAPPSYLWLLVIACFGAATVALAGRLRAGRLAAVAAVVLTLGVLIVVASTLPSLRTGAALSSRAPDLAGFELVDSRLQWWPTIEDYELVALTYRPTEPGTIVLGDGSEESTKAEIDRIAAERRFVQGLPNLRQPCRQYRTEVARPPGQELTPTERQREGDYFCIAGITNDELSISGAVYDTSWLWFRRLFGVPLIGLAAILGILIAIEQATGTKPRKTGSQFAYAVTLLLYAIPLFILGSFAIDATEISRVEGLHDCQETNGPFNDFTTCREYVDDLLTSKGLLDEAELLYGPLIVIADVFCLILVGFGLLLALVVARAGELTFARRRLLIAATVVLLLLAATQFIYWDTIAVTTEAFD